MSSDPPDATADPGRSAAALKVRHIFECTMLLYSSYDHSAWSSNAARTACSALLHGAQSVMPCPPPGPAPY